MCRRRSQHRIWLVAGAPAPCQMPQIGQKPVPTFTNGGKMKKDKQFSIRISTQDLETIRGKAAQAHMSQSDYVTACCLGKRIVILDGLREFLRQQKPSAITSTSWRCWRTWARFSSPIWILLCRRSPRSTMPCGSCRREVRRNRNRPFRELQKRHTDARLHEKCHALCFPTQQDALGWAAARQWNRLPTGNGVRRIPEYKAAAPQRRRRDVLPHGAKLPERCEH